MKVDRKFRRVSFAAMLSLLCLTLSPPRLQAQTGFPDLGGLRTQLPGLDKTDVENPLAISAHFTAGPSAQLIIEAKIQPDWWIYSITQPAGGPMTTKLAVTASSEFEVGKFQALMPPKTAFDDIFKMDVEKHMQTAVWAAPLKIKPGVDPAQLEIRGVVDAQTCNPTKCQEDKYKFVARLQESPAAGGFRSSDGEHTEITGMIEPAVVEPGGTVQLRITATPDRLWHVYALAASDRANKNAKPAVIAVDGQVSQWRQTAPEADSQVVEDDGSFYHEGPVTWTIDLAVPDNAKIGESYLLTGAIGYQACKLGTCDRPAGASFDGQVMVGKATVAGSAPLSFRQTEYGEVERRAKPVAGKPIASLWFILGSALLGGFILNFMPCVLPVIGIKVLSVVEKAHHDRKEIFWLNFWYVFGMVLVFMVLASLAVFASFGWGEQFQEAWFNIAMAALVWTMALSFLGVWEIPIPGFAGGQAANELQQKDGASGAISRGIFTTVLATPCSGPFLGAVFGFTLQQPSWVTYAIFGCMGLGMGLPYIVMGIFPQLVRWLPKPGAWMETFKQIMGFMLLGAVAFMFTFISSDSLPQTFALLIALWAACWWIGRTPLTASLRERVEAYAGGISFAALVGLLLFGGFFTGNSLPWEPFSVARLEQLKSEGKTVMVDFTADWCLTCKLNLATAINTKNVKDVVEANGVVTLLADYTDKSPEIKNMLEQFNQRSIPFLLIYPAGKPNDPIRMADTVLQSDLIDALEQAGPSRGITTESIPEVKTTQLPAAQAPAAALSSQ